MTSRMWRLNVRGGEVRTRGGCCKEKGLFPGRLSGLSSRSAVGGSCSEGSKDNGTGAENLFCPWLSLFTVIVIIRIL